MRRTAQLLPEDETLAILDRGTSGVLAVEGEAGYPYAVPLSYARDGARLYFHSATSGHKLDAIARNQKVSFCVIAADDVVQETFTTRYRSAIVFGRVRVLADAAERRRGLDLLARKYSPDHLDGAPAEIEGSWNRVAVLGLEI
ncbi:MAG: pyridoxamine 5'-phosphate oxidase family protein, partial [Chloroflexi bacterium]|nr:pyridoxamine 5'-phosphate oxidase family protein [Chloroflexota bacterium]